MRILIVSDTHRQTQELYRAIELAGPLDLLVHCGDAEGSEAYIEEKAGCKAEIVVGNNDFFSDLPREIDFMIGNYKVWLTHGHNFYVSMGNEMIKEEAESRGVDIVMYGHTHKPLVEIGPKITAINPGSLTFPRQEGRLPSYIVMELDEQGQPHYEICYLK